MRLANAARFTGLVPQYFARSCAILRKAAPVLPVAYGVRKAPFKRYCALLFCKGALVKDPDGILIQQTPNVQAARQIRFTNLREIVEMERVLKTYIREAVGVEKAGLEVKYKKTSEFSVPEELQKKFDESPAFKMAFSALTPGRQRGYILHFAAAKQSRTREARVEKWKKHILQGKGLND
jgi:uncharacterized protein YdeI (YjbR/CyaY-like superfamily)